MPVNAKIIKIAPQRHEVCIWAEIDTDDLIEERQYMIVPTGQEPPVTIPYFDTVFIGDLVFHVYLENSKPLYKDDILDQIAKDAFDD